MSQAAAQGHRGVRPPESSARDEPNPSSWRNFGPAAQDATPAGDATIIGLDGAADEPPDTGLTNRFAGAAHSTFLAHTVAPGGQEPRVEEDAASTNKPPSNDDKSASKRSWDEDPAVKEVLEHLLELYRRKFELVDVETCEILPYASEGVPSTARYMTLEDRVNMIRSMRLVSEFFSYANDQKRLKPRLKEGVMALMENVANRLKDLVHVGQDTLPYADAVPGPPENWHLLCIPRLGEPADSIGDLSRLFRYAREWINSVASVAEVLMQLRYVEEVVEPPTKPELISTVFGEAAGSSGPQTRTVTPLPDESRRWNAKEFERWQQFNQTPAPVPDFYAYSAKGPSAAHARRVTIQAPYPDRPPHLDLLADTATVRTPANVPQARVSRLAPPDTMDRTATLHDQIRMANETMPLRPGGFARVLTSQSRGEVSGMLSAEPSSPTVRAQSYAATSQFATPATGGEYVSGRRSALLPPITPGQVSVTASPRKNLFPPLGPKGTMDYSVAHLDPFDSGIPRGGGTAPPYSVPLAAATGNKGSAFFPPGGAGAYSGVGRNQIPPNNGGNGWYSGGHGPPGGGFGPPGHEAGGNGPPGHGAGGYGPPGNGGGGGGPPRGGGPPGGGPPFGNHPARPGFPAGGGGGGAPPGGPPGGNGAQPPPNRNEEPRFDMKFKADALPVWNGDRRTAVDYFAQLRRWAELGGALPEQIGRLAPTRFTKDALDWWDNIAEEDRLTFGQNVHTLIYGIRYAYLSEAWARQLVDYFNVMRFRQSPHENETPVAYLRRRAVLCSALWHYDEPTRIIHILAKIPVEWIAILNEHSVNSVRELFIRATELEDQLVAASQRAVDLRKVVIDHIEEILGHKLPRKQYAHRPHVDDPGRPLLRNAPPARAYAATGAAVANNAEELLMPLQEDEVDWLIHSFDEGEEPEVAMAPDGTLVGDFDSVANLVGVYLSDKFKRDAKPKQYPFPRDSRASSNPPPSACRACGGPHWNRECRYYADFEAKMKKGSAAFTAEHGIALEDELLYNVAYVAYRNTQNKKKISAYDVPADDVHSLLSPLSQDSLLVPDGPREPEQETRGNSPTSKAKRASVEEVPDEWLDWYGSSPKLRLEDRALLLEVDEPLEALGSPKATSGRSEKSNMERTVRVSEGVAPSSLEKAPPQPFEPLPLQRESPPERVHARPDLLEEIPDRWDDWVAKTKGLPWDYGAILEENAPHRSTYREPSPTGSNFRLPSQDLVRYSPLLKEELLVNIDEPTSPDNHDRVQDLPDEFDVWYAASAKAARRILEVGGDGYFETSPRRILASAMSADTLLPPPMEKEYWVPAKRHPPAGHSSVGITVLSVQGRLGSRDEPSTTLRLDSGASISLVSEEYLKRMRAPPKVHAGLKITLAQLTDQSPRIKGYVSMPIRIRADDGTRLVFTSELYVVPGMTVEVLLGEDFHVNYEFQVLRNAESGSKVVVGATGYSFTASSTTDSFASEGDEIAGAARERDVKLARALKVVFTQDPSFVRRMWHRRMKANRHRRKKALANGAVRAWKDTVIPAETTAAVEIVGDLQQGREWYVERHLVPLKDETFLTVPNTLLSTKTEESGHPEPGSIARRSFLSVANPTKVPRIVRAGTILGYARDPQQYLNHAGTQEKYDSLLGSAQILAALAKSMGGQETNDTNQPHAGDEDVPTEATASGVKASNALQEEAEKRAGWKPDGEDHADAPRITVDDADDEVEPPAGAEAPDPTVYSSEDLESILDIAADVPRVYREKALALFRKRIKAFGLDGRLGHLDANATIRTKEGTLPISEPTRGASPEKRKVIEAQLEKWFELGVIEPSKSPWAAPVVIVYRNGKARFCVDYRKLNAATIPDEFPIPRQADILSALSGSQVLSSLDALAGFNQTEIAQEDVEKTAFRTHLGLFQFKRMPFGLRNGPAIFQRIMQNILAPYLWLFVLVYIDDIVIYSANYNDHLEHLDLVLEAIEKSGLTLSPEKCHFLYSSILLLGHKVSRLGLSTHDEKVSAIMEIARPDKLQTLQMFLGMVVYFQAFIPYYSLVVTPLFRLLKKGVPWVWGDEQEHAFREVKRCLQAAPVLGHPVQGQPYRLYTDASDEAMGACLQQVQEIRVGDLKGTAAYDRLKAAYDKKESVPILCSRIASRIDDVRTDFEWGESLDATIVETERVVSYWSRTFKSAERNYSATEREALAAKDALVKFLPFVEGEKIILVTDHSALQWARTFENANRRLAAWGLVFRAFPELEIVHRAGRLHSNVDPLSRLPRDPHTQQTRGPPTHVSPAKDTTPAIYTDFDLAELRERAINNTPAPRMAFADVAFCLSDVMEGLDKEVLVTTRAKAKAAKVPDANGVTGSSATVSAPRTNQERADAKAARRKNARPTEGMRYEEALQWRKSNPPPTLQVVMHPEALERFVKGYESDPAFKDKGERTDERSWYAGTRFYRGNDGLLFFRDADFMPRLCVPKSEQAALLQRVHDSAFEMAHAGAAKMYLRMAEKYYWPRMRKDVETYCRTCDSCQKVKAPNFVKYGHLQPHYIPDDPYSRISLDLVTGLPMVDGLNAVLVIIDRLTKHGMFIPTDTGLDTVRFAELFFKHVVCRFGVPEEFVADRDGRWLSHFFEELAKQMGVHMLLSSSHHPQHDGQTERANRTLENMLRNYTANDPSSWPKWLPALEFAYNNTVHSSTQATPHFLLYGYHPRSPSDLLAPRKDENSISRGITAHRGADQMLEEFDAHRQAARDAAAHAQHTQAQAYNKGRRELVLEPGDKVLIRPKTLELVESKGEGVKLMQKAIGPFEVQERVGDATYRIDLPSTFPMSNVIHLDHLRKYEESPAHFGPRSKLQPPRWDQEAAREYQVERIIAHRRNRSKGLTEYLVQWEDYGPQYDEWLTAHQLRNAPARLLDYRRHHGL